MCPWHSIVLCKLCVRVPGHMIVTAVLAVVGVAFVNVTCFLCNENAMPYRCFGKHGPKVLFSSNRRVKRRPEQYWAFDTIDPDWLTTSFFVPTWVLALWRLGIGLFFCASMLLEQYTSHNGVGDPGYVWVSFFTDWTFVVFGFSGVLGCALTVREVSLMTCRAHSIQTHPAEQIQSTPQMAGAQPGVLQPSVQQAPQHQLQTSPQRQEHRQHSNDCAQAASPDTAVRNSSPDVEASGRLPPPRFIRKWAWYEAVFQVVNETSAACSLFVAVFYWAALAGDGSSNVSNKMKHGLNNVLILGDVLLSRVSFVSYHFQISFLFGTSYLIFMWAIWLPIKHYWVYDVFDWGHWKSIGAYAALPVALCISFLIWTGIAALREVAGLRMQQSKRRRARLQTTGAAPAIPLQPVAQPPQWSQAPQHLLPSQPERRAVAGPSMAELHWRYEDPPTRAPAANTDAPSIIRPPEAGP